MKLVCTTVFTLAITTASFADIYQYSDCDGNGTLVLTELDAEDGVNLSGLYLGCANLNYAQLEDANLEGANLEGADLYEADLRFAHLYNANLAGANLTGVFLDSTYFASANLQGADLSGAVHWQESTWWYATFNDATIFPDGMNPEKYGMIYDSSIVNGACCVTSGCDVMEEAMCTNLGGTWTEAGTCHDCVAPPEGGDECAAAIVVVDGANAFDTTNMTAGGSTPDETQCDGTGLAWGESQDGWYMYVATGGMTTFDTCDATSHDTSMVLYEGSCDNQVACNGDSTNQTTCQSFYSEITNYDCVGGETYYIRLGQYSGIGAGPGTLNITPPETCDADLDGDGEVKVADLLLLIGAWGVCP